MDFLVKNIQRFSKGKSKLNTDLIHIAPDYKLLYFNGKESEFIQKEEDIYEIKYEVDQVNKPNSSLKEIYFILGISNINELYSLFHMANPKTIFYIVEPQAGFLKYIFSQFDFKLLNEYDIRIFCDEFDNLPNYLEDIFRTEETLLIRNIKVYGDYFYRNFDLSRFKEFIDIVQTSVKNNLFKFGNSIEDSLIGLAHNTYNMRFLKKSLDFTKMKNCFIGKPAIIVSAGPSLEKNIQEIKAAQTTAVILAVDTIAERLIKEGITPHFIFAIERVYEVYDYFFKDKQYPSETILVVPPVVQPRIIEEFKGQIVLPFRRNVQEYQWFNSIYEFPEEVFMPMGLSVAHLAFGFSQHVGCSPIILTGQDLARGEKGTHIKGTIYDQKPVQKTDENIETEGYYGGKVETTQIWLEFKNLFELEINKYNLNVIDATEGGAYIRHTKRISLKDAIDKYCNDPAEVEHTVGNLDKYKINQNIVEERYINQLAIISGICKDAKCIESILKSININKNSSRTRLNQAVEKMSGTDTVLQKAMHHPLFMHNLQSYFILIFNKFNTITNELSYVNVKRNLEIQLDLCKTIESVGDLMIKTVELNRGLTKEELYSE